MRPTSKSVTGVAASAWIPLDYQTAGPQGDGIYVQVTGTVTYSVEVTPDDIFDSTVTPAAFACGVAALTAASTSQSSNLLFAARAVRVNVTAGTGTAKITVVPRSLQ